jgi:hypothetical protein
MNQQIHPRVLYLILGLFAGLVGLAFVGHQLLTSLDDQDLEIQRLSGELAQMRLKRDDLAKKQAKIKEWQALSLPPDPAVAAARYRGYLLEALHKHRLTAKKLPTENAQLRTTSRTSSLILPLVFDITVEGDYKNLLGFLYDFYQLNLPHALKMLAITPLAAGADAKLEVAMKIEALIVPGAPARSFLPAMPNPRVLTLELITGLKGGPVGLGLALGQLTPTGLYGRARLAGQVGGTRDYQALVAKNVFAGLAPPASTPSSPLAAALEPDREVLKVVQLTSITVNHLTPLYSTVEASLRNRMTNDYQTVRADPPRNTFEVRDARRNLILKGKVVSITPPHVLVFQVDGKFYVLRVGQFLAQALEKELTAEEVKALLTTVTASTMEQD